MFAGPIQKYKNKKAGAEEYMKLPVGYKKLKHEKIVHIKI